MDPKYLSAGNAQQYISVDGRPERLLSNTLPIFKNISHQFLWSWHWVAFSGKLDGNHTEQLLVIFLIQHTSTHTGLFQTLEPFSMGDAW